ncbi:hypothetical protein GDO78_006661 [Eleutherodactylus coqui]|uniref:HAUS augmin-like complex subunit 8 n=1 Tax=Eleutherodactylus coqui TaxID=57060 RepID=A0A8J6FF15_ELECQ|nr:hypothetical protein GDO78_006661 [Eleutherodactylus coqui]
MADSGSNSLESGSQNSSGGSSGDAAQKKVKAPKVVKSRYMQYSKPKATKLKNNVANTTLSPGKGHERSRSGSLKSVGLQRLKAALNKTMQKSSPKSLSTPAQRKSKRETTSAVSIPEDTIEMLESQTLIFTYLTMKMQKNIRRLEDKAERSLLLAHEEKMQLQEKVQQLKRELLLNRREEQLNNLLEKQVESLAPSTAATPQFKANYTTFATALDCTRHQMPIRDIHITGTRQSFLDDVQKHLGSTRALLEATPSSDNDMLDTIKNLEDVVHKTDAELSRSLHQTLDLASKVNKEVSLQSQKLVEENSETEVLRQLYFDGQ